MIEFLQFSISRRGKKKSLNLIDESSHFQKAPLKDFGDDKKEKSKGQGMAVQAATDSLELSPESPYISQKEVSDNSLNEKHNFVSPTGKETPSIFKKKNDQMLKEVEAKGSKNEAFTEVELRDAWKNFVDLRKKTVVSEMEQPSLHVK